MELLITSWAFGPSEASAASTERGVPKGDGEDALAKPARHNLDL
ncbi:MAG: hypothetical protein AAF690_19995 [Acidobacteriota bacterium]